MSLLAENREKPMLDGVAPLMYEGKRIGYLVSSIVGLQLDYILQLAPRPYEGKLSVIELNSDDPLRNGRKFYGDSEALFFTDSGGESQFASTSLMAAIQEDPDGRYVNKDNGTTTYFSETFPYPDRLISWIIAIEVDDGMVSRPFKRLRWGILIFALVILVFSIVAAQFAAGKIARPLALLVENLRFFNDIQIREPFGM